MFPITTCKSVVLFLLISNIRFSDASTTGGHDEDWSYGGANGPDTWPELCQSGRRQSPININPALVDTVNISRLNFENYDRRGTINVTNNGHTVTATGFENWSARPQISGGGLNGQYNLASFHFHWASVDHLGSEHTLGSLSYPLELHLVHTKDGLTQNESISTGDGMAVVSVFFYKGFNGQPLGQLERAFEKCFGYETQVEVHSFLLKEMLPQNLDVFYRYDGSLTTPGCNEAVIWTLMAEPVSVSETQLHRLRKHMSSTGKLLTTNHRKPQPLHERRILFRPNNFDEHCKSK